MSDNPIFADDKDITSRPAFSLSAEGGADHPEEAAAPSCIVNYVWINKEVFSPGENDPPCGIPLRYVDMAIANAQRYPDTKFQIWIDPRFLEQSRTTGILREHLDASGCKNIEVRDLNDIGIQSSNGITNYNQSPSFFTDSEISVWHRVDIARLLVIQQGLEEEPDRVSVYADFDTHDVFLNKGKFDQSIREHGFVLGATTEEAKREWPENGYFAFSNKGPAQTLLSDIMHNVFERTANGVTLERNDVFNGYLQAVLNHCEKHGISDRRTFLLPDILKPPLYKIPHNPRYEGVSL